MRIGTWGLAALFSLVFLAACATESRKAGTSEEGTATIRKVEGSAEISLATGKWQPARTGKMLRSGDSARTGIDGKIYFDLGKNGGVLTLMPESILELEQLGPKSPNDETIAVLNLPKGRVIGDTLKPPAKTKITVKTPEGTREIR